MARLEVDGFAVLHSIGSHPDIFAALARDIARTARMLVIRQIVHKDTGLETVRSIHAAVGPEAFRLIVDAMSDVQIKSLALRMDRHASQARAEDGSARSHILALAEGAVQPLEKQQGRIRAARSKKTPEPPAPLPRVHYESAGATRKR
jgi:hypothetical protein